jgi:hypothetical protein
MSAAVQEQAIANDLGKQSPSQDTVVQEEKLTEKGSHDSQDDGEDEIRESGMFGAR